MVSAVHASARVFRVRTEFLALSREMRLHVLCECGSGAWIVAIAPFPDLFFDARPLIGHTVGDAVIWLGSRYAGLRILADILESPGCRRAPSAQDRPPAGGKTRPPRRRPRPPEGQDELPLAPLASCPSRSPPTLFPSLVPDSGRSRRARTRYRSQDR